MTEDIHEELKGPFLPPPINMGERGGPGPGSFFGSVQEQERQYIQDLRDRIRKIEGELGLCNRILVAKNSPGFMEFIKAVTNKRDLTRRDLEVSSGSNEELRVLQGRTQALSSMALILTDTEHLKQNLERELESLKQQYEATARPDGRVIPPNPFGG